MVYIHWKEQNFVLMPFLNVYLKKKGIVITWEDEQEAYLK